MSAEKADWTPELDKENSKAVWAHTIPFLVWLLMMSLLGDPTGTRYAIQTLGGIILLLIFRPWRWYEAPKLKNIPLALAVGLLVFVFWVGLESEFFKSAFPKISEFYERWFVDMLRIGKLFQKCFSENQRVLRTLVCRHASHRQTARAARTGSQRPLPLRSASDRLAALLDSHARHHSDYRRDRGIHVSRLSLPLDAGQPVL